LFSRGLLPGAVLGAVAFTALITVGTGLMTHQLKNASATYGAFGYVIGMGNTPPTRPHPTPSSRVARHAPSIPACLATITFRRVRWQKGWVAAR
jgi:hypothetical protein